ncbi:hypothetical protein [Nitrospira sp. Kam-Ns4a]
MRGMSFRWVTAWLLALCGLWALAGSVSGGLTINPDTSREEEQRQRAAEGARKQRAVQAPPVVVGVPCPGRSWAVVIGINRYAKAPGVPAQRFAEQDALEVGAADLNGDGVIPVSELYAFLDRRVFDAAQVHRREQRPALWRLGADAGEFVFLVDQPVRLAKDSPGPVR